MELAEINKREGIKSAIDRRTNLITLLRCLARREKQFKYFAERAVDVMHDEEHVYVTYMEAGRMRAAVLDWNSVILAETPESSIAVTGLQKEEGRVLICARSGEGPVRYGYDKEKGLRRV